MRDGKPDRLPGPPLFESRRGPVFLRRRHLPFAIAGAERDQWLMCMRLALDEVVADAELRAPVPAHGGAR